MKLFHQTEKKNIKSIMKRGLGTNKSGWLYLSPRSDLGFGEITLEVETGNNKLTAFDDCKDWEVLCWGTIPPENIKVFSQPTLLNRSRLERARK